MNGSFCSQIDALSDNPSVKEFKKYVRTVFSCPHYCEKTSGASVIRKIIDSLCYCDISLQARRMQYFKLLIKRVNSKTILKSDNFDGNRAAGFYVALPIDETNSVNYTNKQMAIFFYDLPKNTGVVVYDFFIQ